MIQFNIHTPDGKLRISSPATWSEVNLSQFIKLEVEWDQESILDLFSIITGVDVAILQNSRSEGLEDKMLAICAFAYNSPNWENIDRPDIIQIGEDFHKTPSSLSKIMLGQKILISQIAIKEGKDLVSNIPKIIATIMQAEIDGKYDEDRLAELEKEILNSPAIACYGLAKFFFRKSAHSMKVGDLDSVVYPPRKIPTMRLLRGLRKLIDSAPIPTSP